MDPHEPVASSHTQAVAPSMHTASSVVSVHGTESGVPLSVESRHTAELLQGSVSHSSSSMEHVSPVKPVEQSHVKPFTRSVHSPPFAHGSSAHSSMSVEHVVSSNPGAQEHKNSPYITVLGVPDSVQMASFRHGSGVHSSASMLHVAPLVPAGQSHTKPAAELEQLASAVHGRSAQKSSSSSQFKPPNDGAQLQVRKPRPSTHVPPLRHGACSHSRISEHDVPWPSALS
jgi:hypothetical protein